MGETKQFHIFALVNIHLRPRTRRSEPVDAGRRRPGSDESLQKGKSGPLFNCDEITRLLISPA